MLKHVDSQSVITGWDFSTGAVKCVAFDINGNVLAESRFPTELYTKEDGTIELSLLQLEGQARQTTRDIAAKLKALGRLQDWAAGGISATHHTAGRIDANGNQVRRAICWNDQTLAQYHEIGQQRLGGAERVHELIGMPWAIRYSLSHLVKDESTLATQDWERTQYIAPHGTLAAGYLTGNFNGVSISSAASTGLLDLRTRQWKREMLDALENPGYRALAWKQLPQVLPDFTQPVGTLERGLAAVCGMLKEGENPAENLPLIFPTNDDQQAGLVGGGAVEDGQVAIVLGNSVVVNSSSAKIPSSDVNLDVMALNWGPYLLMRCYNNGAYFMDRVLGDRPNFGWLEERASRCSAGANGTRILPFLLSEPSLGVTEPNLRWIPQEPTDDGERFRACLEALACLIALGVEEHQKAGQTIRQISVSGGIAKSDLMCEILASMLDFPLQRLESEEGPALGAAVTALAGLENHRRRLAGDTQDEPYTVEDAVHQMVRFRATVKPNPDWVGVYRRLLEKFRTSLQS